jgi:uncharacterized protein YaiI (UPF0178 family)
MPNPIAIYIDADACPVKQEFHRVAERYLDKSLALHVFVVSNSDRGAEIRTEGANPAILRPPFPVLRPPA